MNLHSDSTPSLNSMIRDFRASWKTLVLTDILFKCISFIVLTPIVAVMFRLMLSLSGKEVLADQDIMFFLLGPPGWLCLVLVGAVSLGIIGLEQASLMGIMGARKIDKHLGVLAALQFAASKAWPVLQVTTRIVVYSLIAIAPFLAIAGLVFATLLTEFDINYYLKEKPPVFQLAVGIGGVLAIGLAGVLLRLSTGWFFALPLVIFEDVRPSESLKASRERVNGHRRSIALWILGWALSMAALSSLATAIVGLLGRLIVPGSMASLQLLAAAIGLTLLVWTVISLAVNLITTISFATLELNLYLGFSESTNISGRNRETLETLSDFEHGQSGFQITRRRMLVAGVVGLAVAVVVGVYAVRSIPDQDSNVLVMAHRGSSAAAPENTMAAIRKAIDDGADWVEIDVQETADGSVVVLHDSDFMKTAGRNLKIWNATLEDLKGIDIGSWFAPEFKNERVPTLIELLDECHGKINVNIELKYYGHDQQLEQRVADIVEQCNMVPNVMIMSLKMDGVNKMKSLRPDWKVGLLMSVARGDLTSIDVDFFAVNAAFVSRGFIQDVHDDGKEVYVWTVNDAPTMSNMIGRGVDALLTDKPALARRVIEQRAEMSFPERLLLELAGLLGATPEIAEQ